MYGEGKQRLNVNHDCDAAQLGCEMPVHLVLMLLDQSGCGPDMICISDVLQMCFVFLKASGVMSDCNIQLHACMHALCGAC
jgi:hypothetical protein